MLKTVIRDKEVNYGMIKDSIQQGDTTMVNIYTTTVEHLNTQSKYLKDIKRETESKTLRVGDFSTPLTSMDRSARWKISKETGFEGHIRPDGINRYAVLGCYILYIIHILFECNWNILQDRSQATK